jgi:hypothetical protein
VRTGKILFTLLLLPFCLACFSGCGGSTITATTQTGSKQSAASTAAVTGNGPASTATAAPKSDVQAGDIPDTQAFVLYSSTTGSYALEVPEGWARTATATDVGFIDKLDGVQVTVTTATSAPTVDSVRTQQAATLLSNGHAVQDIQVKSTQLANGTAILITFTSNSAPDAVTGKQIRQNNNQYLFFKHGKLATLTLWAPLGADNTDQWARMSQSFRWV